MVTFLERLRKACERNRSLLCVGLDPDQSLMPTRDVYAFNRSIIDATIDLVCAYKPNLAFYEAMGLEGLTALRLTVEYIRKLPEEVLVIGDAKRGDISTSSRAYSKALFDYWGFDAVTVNGYGGRDSIQPFLDYEERGVFIWCRSSNPGAQDFQDLEINGSSGKRRLYQKMAEAYQCWNTNDNIGLVVGATYPDELKYLRTLCPRMPILIPGVGAQEGNLAAAVLAGTDTYGHFAVINSSRGVIYASQGSDYAAAARQKACLVRQSINDILERENRQWF